MSERPRPEEEGMTRRDFLKFAAGTAALGAAGAAGAYRLKENGEKISEALINEMMSNKEQVHVEKGGNLWDYYEKSGWEAEEPGRFDCFREAVKRLNPNENIDNLQPSMNILIPINNGE